MSSDETPPVDSTEWLAATDVSEDQRAEVSKQRKQDWWERNVGGKRLINVPEQFRAKSSARSPQTKYGPRGGRYTEDRTKDGRPYRRYF